MLTSLTDGGCSVSEFTPEAPSQPLAKLALSEESSGLLPATGHYDHAAEGSGGSCFSHSSKYESLVSRSTFRAGDFVAISLRYTASI